MISRKVEEGNRIARRSGARLATAKGTSSPRVPAPLSAVPAPSPPRSRPAPALPSAAFAEEPVPAAPQPNRPPGVRRRPRGGGHRRGGPFSARWRAGAPGEAAVHLRSAVPSAPSRCSRGRRSLGRGVLPRRGGTCGGGRPRSAAPQGSSPPPPTRRLAPRLPRGSCRPGARAVSAEPRPSPLRLGGAPLPVGCPPGQGRAGRPPAPVSAAASGRGQGRCEPPGSRTILGG